MAVKSVRLPGSVREISPGRWRVTVDLGKDEYGRRQQVTRMVYGNQKDATKKATELLASRDRGIDLRPQHLTVRDYLEDWLKTYASRRRDTTFKRYAELMRVHVIPYLGKVVLNRLQPRQVAQAYQRVRDKGLSERTALNVHRVLREALQHAYREGLVLRNPCDQTAAPRPERFQPIVLGPEQLTAIIAAAETHGVGSLVKTAVWTGMREGELLSLTWADVNLETRRISVRGRVKTRSSVRVVSISDSLVEVLKAHRAAQNAARLKAKDWQDLDLVFPTGRGTPDTNLRRTWTDIVEDAKTPGARFHDLRHAHATLLLEMGEDLKVVSERLGHSSIGITADIYQHVRPHRDAEAAARVDAYFQQAKEKA